jgi:hypothetical protein
MFNWVKDKSAQEAQDSTVVRAAVDVVFSEKYGADTQRDGNLEYAQMREAAAKAAQPVISDKWSSHDDIYQAAKKAI